MVAAKGFARQVECHADVVEDIYIESIVRAHEASFEEVKQ